MEQKPKVKSLVVSEEMHTFLLKHCPEGYKIKNFHERVIKAGVEAIKKGEKRK